MDTAVTELRFTQDFINNLTEIVDYIACSLHNPDAAQRLSNDVQSAIQERLKAPTAFEPYHSRLSLSDTWYRIHVRNYTIFYVVKEDTMEVRRILFRRRNWTAIL